jgi:hypothetical protein
MVPVDYTGDCPDQAAQEKLFRLGLAASGFLFLGFGGGYRGLGATFCGSGLGRLFCHFFGINDYGGGGILLY